MKPKSAAFFSLFLIFFGIFGSFAWNGGSLSSLMVPSQFMIVFLGTLGITALTFGWSATLNAIKALSLLWSEDPNPQVNVTNRNIFQFMAERTYCMGCVASIMGIMITMGHLGGDKQDIGNHVVSSLSALVYAAIFSEVLLRPAAARIDFLLQHQETTSKLPCWIWMLYGLRPLQKW